MSMMSAPRILVSLVALFLCLGPVTAQDGFCRVNGTTTGGEGGTTVTVTNGTDFITQITTAGARIIQVQGVLSIGKVKSAPNKTILGLGTNATLLGNINVSDTTNVIIRNLRITGPANDGLTIWNAQHVWIDHCTFYDTGDGLCDMNRGSQYVTVSWCKFHYVRQLEHQFTMIADGYDNTTAGTTNYGYYTLHHNWWSTGSHERMPASSFGRIHMYNNFFNCTNDMYCSNARNDTEINSENNYYIGVVSPVSVSSGTTGKIRTTGNIYIGCSGTIDSGSSAVFTPPYDYALDAVTNVPAIVRTGAGAPGPDTMAVPPKIWDGGGSGNNWSTAANWGLKETPKVDDVLVFAGATRLTPNNDITSGTEYYGLVFSNDAGAFVLGGNAFNMGGSITDDSSAVQTINAGINFAFGQYHYTSNRCINVTSAAGSLVLNGRLAGASNAYFPSYCLIKEGPGLLTLGGMNTHDASLFLNGGLVRFSSLDTNQAGSLGDVATLTFNGGGLQWATNNSADISARVVTVSTNGATLDVGTNNVTLSGRIGNGGPGGVTKLGSGTLTFIATNNYRGNTLIAQGALALAGGALLMNSPRIILSNNAALDVSARSDGTLTLLNSRSLLGNGTVRGSVIAASGSTIAPGFSTGALTVTNTLTFQSGSTNVMEIDAAAHSGDLITGMAAVNFGGRLIVTNLAGTPAAGDSFKLFGAARFSGAFAGITLPALSGNLAWTNKLAIDGTIAVVSVVNASPTNLTSSVTNGMLVLTWPQDHTGWRLQIQTNRIAEGIWTNWQDVTGSQATNRMFVPVNATNGCVFLRLIYP